MPPHCDTLDGPVVKGARRALATGNVSLVLPYVPAAAEEDVRAAFKAALAARTASEASREVADRWFFETVVRLHRAGEGQGYTGLKPAGLDWGPIVPLAEGALESGDAEPVLQSLANTVRHALAERFEKARHLRDYDPKDVEAARAYVEASLDFALFAHHLHTYVHRGEGHGGDNHGHGD